MEIIDLQGSNLTFREAAALIGHTICRVKCRSDELTLVMENEAELQIMVGTWDNPEALLVDFKLPSHAPGDASQFRTTNGAEAAPQPPEPHAPAPQSPEP